MIKYRPQRGSLVEAMKEYVELPDRNALEEHVLKTWSATRGPVEVKPYCGADDRIGWDATFIVLVDGSPVGFTDKDQ